MGSLPLKITHQREKPLQFCCPVSVRSPKGQHGSGRQEASGPSQGGERLVGRRLCPEACSAVPMRFQCLSTDTRQAGQHLTVAQLKLQGL